MRYNPTSHPLLSAALAIALILTAHTTPAAPPAAPPAPTPAVKEKEIKRNAEGQPVADILFPNPAPISLILEDFSSQTGVRVETRGKLPATLAFQGNQLTAEGFLNSISDANKLKWRKTATGYELWDLESWNAMVVPTLKQQKVFIPVHISAKYLYDAITQAKILTNNIGNAAMDERTNKVIVTDLPEVLALVQDMINLLDEPQFTRVFHIKYAQVKDVVDKIKDFKSNAGTIDSEELSHMVIVRDVLPNIQRMETMIDLLDIRQIRRVYNLNTIGFDGKAAADLKANLDLLVTPKALYVIDPARGLLILEDTETVHEDVEKFLQVFDRPIDQIRIEAELLDVDQTNSLSFGTEFGYNPGLLSSSVADAVTGTATGTGTGTTGIVTTSNRHSSGGSGSGGLNLGYINTYVKAQLSAALSDINTRVLMRPSVAVKNRETVKLRNTKETPITQVQYTNYGYNTSSTPVITSVPVESGLTVEISPTASPTGLIEMKVNIENSSADTVDIPTGISTQPIVQGVKKSIDNVQTILTVPDGETRVISGLLDHAQGENKSGVPVLVRIPWLGPLLFGKQSNNDRVRNLLFFVTPTILRETPRGSIVAHEFDAMSAGNKWDTSTIPPPAAPGILKDKTGNADFIMSEDILSSPSLFGKKRFPAKTIEEYRAENREMEDALKEAQSKASELEKPKNTPETKAQNTNDTNSMRALEAAVRKSGGKMPNFDQAGKKGWSGVVSKSTAAPVPGVPIPGAPGAPIPNAPGTPAVAPTSNATPAPTATPAPIAPPASVAPPAPGQNNPYAPGAKSTPAPTPAPPTQLRSR